MSRKFGGILSWGENEDDCTSFLGTVENLVKLRSWGEGRGRTSTYTLRNKWVKNNSLGTPMF
jgi:hypothetical protein